MDYGNNLETLEKSSLGLFVKDSVHIARGIHNTMNSNVVNSVQSGLEVCGEVASTVHSSSTSTDSNNIGFRSSLEMEECSIADNAVDGSRVCGAALGPQWAVYPIYLVPIRLQNPHFSFMFLLNF